ncbi:hypothetical protein INA88_002427 [Escherichia coli]|nr:hypothetical protein [Escherichia coli]
MSVARSIPSRGITGYLPVNMLATPKEILNSSGYPTLHQQC